eukprot:scaffold2917_cov59-Phaeocystis_antarctica.AAC.3
MSSWELAIVVTLASAALDTLAEDALWRLLIRPLVRLNEPVDRAFMVRLRRPFPWVAPRACATSARLTARCGSVWRAMAMSLPQGTHRALGGRMLNRATS